MRVCSGADEYEAGKEKKKQYTHYKKLDYTTEIHPPPRETALYTISKK